MAEDNRIDELLARYLELLDTYTSLRASLSELHSSVYQSLARANFSAERGVRYGQDFYDERMQAAKTVIAEEDDDGVPRFDLLDLNAEASTDAIHIEAEKLDPTNLEETEKVYEDEKTTTDAASDPSAEKETKPSKSRDPLRWFGILAPPPLRQAQTSASRLVQTAVNIASVDAEMKSLEIEIRRARKRKAKNKKAASVVKKEEEGETRGGAKEDGGDETEPHKRTETVKTNRGGGCGRVAI